MIAIEIAGKDLASPAIKSATASLGGLEKAGPAASKGLGSFTDAIGKVGLGLFGAGQVFSAVSGAIAGFVGDAIESEKVTAQLNAVLASTKGVAGVSADAVNALSTALSKVTPFEDEAITGAQSLLLTFTNIGADAFPQATESVLNMSQALGQDLKSSAIQLGKALNDPIAGVGALRRVGVQLSDEQKGLVQSFMDVGDIAGAQGVILAELDKEFGGTAKAAGQTFAGSLVIAQTALGNVKEAIGGPFIAVLGQLLTQLAPVLSDFADALPGALATTGAALAPVVAFVKANLGPVLAGLVPVLAVVAAGFVALIAPAVGAAVGIALAFAPVVLAIGVVAVAVGLLKAAWDMNLFGVQDTAAAVWAFLSAQVFVPIQTALADFGAVFLPEFLLAWANVSAGAQLVWSGLVAFLMPAIDAFAVFWTTNWTTIQSVLQLVWDAMTLVVKVAWDVLTTLILTALDVLQGDWSGAWDRIKGLLQRTWDAMGSLVGRALDLLQAALTAAWGAISSEVSKWWDTVAADLARIWNDISANVTTMVNGIGAFLQQSWDAINKTADEWWTTIKDTIWNSIKPLADMIGGLVKGVQETLNSIKAPDIKLPTIAGVSVGSSPGQAVAAAVQGGIDWGKKNFDDNAAKADADNRARAGKGAGPEVVGGDAAANAPSEIAWAMARIGQAGWVGLCERFVEMANGTSGRYASAWAAANALMTNPGGGLAGAPRGALVFFRPDASNGGWGHVGIALGDGRMVSATNNGPEVTGPSSYWNGLFAGWGLPRFAKGVTNFGGGMAIVGEAGPELVRLPRGVDVIPNHRMASVGGGDDYDRLADAIASKLGAQTIVMDGQVVGRVQRIQDRRFTAANAGLGGVGGALP